MKSDGDERMDRLLAQAGARARPLSRPRPRLRPGRGGERGTVPRGRGPWAALPFWADTGKARAHFRFFLFPGKLKIQIGSKEKSKRKIEKGILPVGKIQEID